MKQKIFNLFSLYSGLVCIAAASVSFVLVTLPTPAQAAQEDGAVGLTATIPSPPPTQGATIAVPSSGSTFTELPVRVSGLCPDGLLVKLFKNNVFAGSQQCTGGSYAMDIDLFTGQNDLVAKVYDALDQPGPDSNVVTASFVDNRVGAGTRVSVTSNFAKRGANPGDTLTWPILISGGSGPYAISVDWGDGKELDLKSQPFAGAVNLTHIYDSPGVYNIVVKVSDADGVAAFLQLVGVGNGPLSQINEADNNATDEEIATRTKTKIIWQPAALIIPFIVSTFWLGKKYELRMLRHKISRGERPF